MCQVMATTDDAGEQLANWAVRQAVLREACRRPEGYFPGRVTGADELLYWAPEVVGLRELGE